jgi:hypothetical protein
LRKVNVSGFEATGSRNQAWFRPLSSCHAIMLVSKERKWHVEMGNVVRSDVVEHTIITDGSLEVNDVRIEAMIDAI